MKKLNKETALAKLKALISKFYEDAGREIIDIDEAKQELIENIDEILNETEISIRHLIIEKMELDKKNLIKENI